MTRKETIDVIARELAMWGGQTGPEAMRLAQLAVARLELEGLLSFASDDHSGR